LGGSGSLIVWLALASARAGSETHTSAADWSASSFEDNVETAGDALEIDTLLNEVSGWYRSTWGETRPLEAQLDKDDNTWFSVPDRCFPDADNVSFRAPTKRLDGYELRVGPHTDGSLGARYMAAVPSGTLLDLPQLALNPRVRLLVGGARIAQQNLTVRFHYTDGTLGSVVVPIALDTVSGAARDLVGVNYVREGVTGLDSVSDSDWDKTTPPNGSDCVGDGADIVTVTAPASVKYVESISFFYTGYEDPVASSGWLGGPLAVSLPDVKYDSLYTYRGEWASSLVPSQSVDAGRNALFYRISWNADVAGTSEIYLDVSCGDDADGDNLLEPSELSPAATLLLSTDTSPYDLATPCVGRYLTYEVELVDSFTESPQLQDVTFSFDPDGDGDGYGAEGAITEADCNDSNAQVSPGQEEVPGNNQDDDCDGTELCYQDADNDGARHATNTVVSTDTDCNDANEALGADPIDCDDNDASRSPFATEIVGDDIDQDCDDHDACYQDSDRDGYGSAVVRESVALLCLPANFEAKVAGDCDDNNDDRFPGNTETTGDNVDQDCDSHDRCYVDADGDDFGTALATVDAAGALCTGPGESTLDTDCDDTDDDRYPGAIELVGDDVDEDCDERVSCYVDADDDGARTMDTLVTAVGDTDCTDPFEGQVADALDCDDANALVRPGAPELAGDNLDQDCDDQEDCYVDADDDGARGVEIDAGGSNGDLDCDDSGEGRATDLVDCDDTDAARYPGAVEIPADGLDADCDDTELCYVDADDDGARTEDTAPTSPGDFDCLGPFEGEAADALDCDDTNSAVFPGADELCNAQDDDCNGVLDDGAGPVVSWYADTDGDTYGDPLNEAQGACGPDDTWVTDDGDCDDQDPNVNPDAIELCNGLDDDCNAEIDEVVPAQTWYADGDGDGFGDPQSSVDAGCQPDEGFVSDASDCDDSNPAVNPEGSEVCNGIDDDCQGGIDHLGQPTTWYQDLDGDGVGVDAETVQADCPPGPGWAEATGDCDDTDAKLTDTCLAGGGCGCSETPPSPLLAWPLIGLMLGIRRRR
jgi:uncharacterized protein (TIGR03382 family)